ncbi:MAG: hypothetical protein MJZ40_02300 [Bacteroidaceae bacterium]|nr:hypothetical protein [Bacteroidaceae bacterium]
MGRNKYSQREIDLIVRLLRRKCAGNRFQQKQVRHILRTEFEFSIADFGKQGQAFGPDELEDCIRRGVIHILDDATIEAMKAKRARDRAHDEANAPTPSLQKTDPSSDWQAVLRQWEEWEQAEGEKNV